MQVAARRIAAPLCTGAIAITLWSADLINLQTEDSGLLKLLVQLSGVSVPHSKALNILFQIGIGLAMAVGYSLLLKSLWRAPAWLFGLGSATAEWVANAFVVLL